ncbi:hypothetical protein GCM10009861_22780 [Neomicrococcus aestuarii]
MIDPHGEIPVLCRGNAHVIVEFLIDIAQAAGERPDMTFGSEREPNGVAWGRVRILTQYDGAHRGRCHR